MKIVFFDGYCSLCNGFIDWLMKRSRDLKFASLQGETAKRALPKFEVSGDNDGGRNGAIDPDTIVYLRDGATSERSTAILEILVSLGGFWSLAKILLLIPSPLRDLVYRAIAKSRYRLFPRRDTCRLPLPEEKDRLLP